MKCLPKPLFCLLYLSLSTAVLAQEALISAFEGSETVASYQTRFAELPLLVPPLEQRNIPTAKTVEGALVSHIYRRPEGVEPFEVYRSYLDALQQGGFEVLLDCRAPDCNLKLSVPPVYQHSGVFGKRGYGRMPTGTDVYLLGWAEHYLSAKKTLEDRTYHAMVVISSQHGLYSVDVIESAERKADTVSLSQALLATRLNDEGRSVLDGIFFETGNAVIKPESAEALEVIAAYLEAHPATRYYVVGHTDDAGDLQANVVLSHNRAAGVAEALTGRGIETDRLSAQGVGPFSPVASNSSEVGRALNRRVELVLRLD